MAAGAQADAALLLAEKERENASPVACAISVMLLGSIGFMMLLFYLVNWPDRDIRRYSWQVISKTISIFCAVMIFQGCNGLVEKYLIEGGNWTWEVFLDMSQLVVWLTAMQAIIAVSSGAISEMFSNHTPDLEQVVLNSRSWSVLFAHVAGFAAMNAWGSLQQSAFGESPLLSLVVVPLGFLGLFCMYHGYDSIREYVSHMDDGVKDRFETLWDEVTEEAEDEVAGLSLSFLAVQSLRFWVGGALPNTEGGEPFEASIGHGWSQWRTILGVGGGCFLLSLVPLLLGQAAAPREEEGERELTALQEKVQRAVKIANSFFTFGTGWCLFYGVQWALLSLDLTRDAPLRSVVLALLLSVVSAVCIFGLDYLEDHRLLGTDPKVADIAAEKMITSLGTLIGFSWEQSFDTALEVMADGGERICPPAVTKLAMSILLVVIVFPAWRLYILKAERRLVEGAEEHAALDTVFDQHRELFLSREVDEAALDMAHLQMKQHRRRAHNNEPEVGYVPPGLRHLRITVEGITEVGEVLSPTAHRGRAAKRREEVRSLLG